MDKNTHSQDTDSYNGKAFVITKQGNVQSVPPNLANSNTLQWPQRGSGHADTFHKQFLADGGITVFVEGNNKIPDSILMAAVRNADLTPDGDENISSR